MGTHDVLDYREADALILRIRGHPPLKKGGEHSFWYALAVVCEPDAHS